MMIDRGAIHETRAMLDPEKLRKYALECLRLEAECMQLAGDAPDPNSQSHFLRMARVWFAMAVSGPNPKAGQEFFVPRRERHDR
jgi:hypothetical protein